MAVDDELLAETKNARTQMEALEDAAWEARARFHQAMRRLHHAGASLREIAAALGMSHQRVHQIVGEGSVTDVEPAGAMVPATTRVTDDACGFCSAPRREVDRTLTGPGGTFVCGSCVLRARQSLEGDVNMAAGTTVLVTLRGLDPSTPCTFCRNPLTTVGTMVGRSDGGVRMCRSCLEACERMLAPPGQYNPKGPAMKRKTLVRCSFCNVSQKNTKKLIAGPGVYVCEVCIAAAGAVIAGAPSAPSRSVTVRANPGDCAFCGKARAKVNAVAGASRGRICNECVDLCLDILREDSRA